MQLKEYTTTTESRSFTRNIELKEPEGVVYKYKDTLANNHMKNYEQNKKMDIRLHKTQNKKEGMRHA